MPALAQEDQSEVPQALYRATQYEIRDSTSNAARHTELGQPTGLNLVYTFTEDDIKRAAVRDLMELLNTVPSLAFGADVTGTLAIGVRGNFAGESIALVVDGVVMNEGMYGSIQLAGKLQLTQIKQVDVIIGPAAAAYGQFAAYGAIIITTKAYQPFTGLRVGWTQGFQSPAVDARVASSLSIGKQGADWSIAATGSVASSVLSFGQYKDLDGHSYNMANNSTLTNRFASAQVRYRNTSLTVLSDFYQLQSRDAYVFITSQAYHQDFLTFSMVGRHLATISPRLKLQFLGGFKTQDPYKALDDVAPPDSNFYTRLWLRDVRAFGGVQATYNPTPGLQFSLAGQASRDWGYELSGLTYFPGQPMHLAYNILSGVAKVNYTYRNTSIYGSARVDNHSTAGTYLAPSFGAVQKLGKVYVKASYAQSYRLPAVINIYVGPSDRRLLAQKVNQCDVEAGYKTTKGLHLGASVFYTKTKDAIAYMVRPEGEESYVNARPFATRGFELFARQTKGLIRFQFGYSSYSTVKGLCSNQYKVVGHSTNLGLPSNKITLGGSVSLRKSMDASIQAIFLGSRYGVTDQVWNGEPGVGKPVPVYSRYDRNLTLNLYLRQRIAVAQGLDITLGISDIFNQGALYVQPYLGYHMPLPGPGREYIIAISYALDK